MLRLPAILSALFFPLFAATLLAQSGSDLQPFLQNGLYGYQNHKGEQVIAPQFKNAGNFTEGLAPVRVGGLYGFINKKGKLKIKPVYDYAESFSNGAAGVRIDGKPYLIDKKGHKLFEHDFTEMIRFGSKGNNWGKTETGNWGMIDAKGHIILDTIYAQIQHLEGDLCLAYVPYTDTIENWNTSIQYLVNSKGKVLFGYWGAGPIQLIGENYALCYLPQTDKRLDDSTIILDWEGRKHWQSKQDLSNFLDPEEPEGRVHEGKIIGVNFLGNINPDSVSYEEWVKARYPVLYDIEGHIVFGDPNSKTIGSFKHRRAFVTLKNGASYLIDSNGRKIGADQYERTETDFEHGYALVKLQGEWLIIDTNGVVLSRLPDDFSTNESHFAGNYLFFEEDDRWGFVAVGDSKFVWPQFSKVDLNFGFVNGYLHTYMTNDQLQLSRKYGPYATKTEDKWDEDEDYDLDNSMDDAGMENYEVWVDKKGKVVRYRRLPPENIAPTDLKSLDVDYMLRGHFHAASPEKAEYAGFGGWGGSDNVSAKIQPAFAFLPDSLQIQVLPDQKQPFYDIAEGMACYMANTGKDTIVFEASDSRLDMVLQVLDRHGRWRSVEYLPSSWCGNSYHQVYLAPGEMWQFTVPKFEGVYKTRYRVQLTAFRHSKESEESKRVLYSNEFEGGYNPAQTWRKEAYQPGGLMDPYND